MTNKTVYLNMKTSQGIETVDEFSKKETQTYKEFRKYVTEMIREYHIAGMQVYRSQRCTKEWTNK